MRLLFLFMSRGSAVQGTTPDNYKPKGQCHKMYKKHNGEGYFRIVEELLKQGIFNDAYVFYESNRGPGIANWVNHPNAHCEVIPEIRFVEKYITEDTVIWVRGGFKHWFELLMKYKGKNWLVVYAANTGREKWRFWDVVLNDIDMIPGVDRHERLNFPFVKPVDESIFYYKENVPIIYDLCIGASYIHDKKGQWQAVEAIEYLNNEYGRKIKAIMPGSVRRSIRTVEMLGKIKKSIKLNAQVYFPSFVSKENLCHLFNQSKFFCHMGNHGQNDRGPLEAWACGTKVILRSPMYHSPTLTRRNSIIVADKYELAGILSLETLTYDKRVIANSFKEFNGCQEVVFPSMNNLFTFLTKNKPNYDSKYDLLRSIHEQSI